MKGQGIIISYHCIPNVIHLEMLACDSICDRRRKVIRQSSFLSSPSMEGNTHTCTWTDIWLCEQSRVVGRQRTWAEPTPWCGKPTGRAMDIRAGCRIWTKMTMPSWPSTPSCTRTGCMWHLQLKTDPLTTAWFCHVSLIGPLR